MASSENIWIRNLKDFAMLQLNLKSVIVYNRAHQFWFPVRALCFLQSDSNMLPLCQVQLRTKNAWRAPRQLAVSASVFLFPAAVILGFAYWQAGSGERIVPYLRGEKLVFSPSKIDAGIAEKNTLVVRQIHVANISNQYWNLISCSKECGCITLNEFPIRIAPHSNSSVEVRIRLPPTTGQFSKSFKLFADTPDKTLKEFFISGEVVAEKE